MIVKRALFREAALNSLAVLAVLAVLMLFIGLTQSLGKAAMGKRAAEAVFQVLALETVRSLDTLLPLAMFLGILLGVSRWYRDNEMTVLSACGISPSQLLSPIMLLAGINFFIVAVISLYVSPMVYQAAEVLSQQGQDSAMLQAVQPGVFNSTQVAGQVFYVESLDDTQQGFKNVFVTSPLAGQGDGTKQGVILATRGRQLTDNKTGEQILQLQQGTYYEGSPGLSDYRIVSFDSYSLRWLPRQHNASAATSINGMSTRQLMRSSVPRLQAEFHWRLAKPIAIFVLAIYAMVLAYTDARRGRSGNIVTAILLFFIYSNVLGVGTGMIRHGELPAAAGLWWVHGIFAVLAWYMLSRRIRNRPLLTLPHKRPA